MRKVVLAAFLWVGLLCVLAVLPASAGAKNVILMIADGWGYNQVLATNYYTGAPAVYEDSAKGFKKWAMSTYPLNLSGSPTGNDVQDANLVYDPAKAWSKADEFTWSGGKLVPGANGVADAYDFLRNTYTDSAAAATVLNTGKKTYNSSINWSNTDQPITDTIAKRFKDDGRGAGAVSTVQWSHATPAGVYAHSASRGSYEQIAKEGVYGKAGDGKTYGPLLDVIMGAGNPDFNDNGQPASNNPQMVGGADAWAALKENTVSGVTHIQTRAEFLALPRGNAVGRYIGTFAASSTSQQGRTAQNGENSDSLPYTTPRLTTTPTLSEMSLAALNVLSSNAKGFYLMVEGGAIDWANHANHKGRMIEEMIDFNDAVSAVCGWVEAHSSWDETLVIVTGDHETGLLWGPNSSDSNPFDPVSDNGPGKMPGMKYNYSSHTNSLLPLYAKGVGADLFAEMIDGTDPVRGAYVDNSDVFKVATQAAVLATAVPAQSEAE